MSLSSTSMPHLRMLLDNAGVLQRENNSLFSRRGFIAWRVLTFVGYSSMLICSGAFVFTEANESESVLHKMKSLMLFTALMQVVASHCVLLYRKIQLEHILNQFDSIYAELKGDSSNVDDLIAAERKNRSFLKNFVIILVVNVVSTFIQASVRVYLTGKDSKPYELSYLGMNPVAGWIHQFWTTLHPSCFVIMFYTVVKGFTTQLTAFTTILSRMIKLRPTKPDSAYDRRMLRLFSDIACLSISITKLLGVTGFIEILLSSTRGCFAGYHTVMAISNKNYDNLAGGAVSLFTSFLFTFVLSSCGEELQSQMGTIRLAIAESKWFEGNPSRRRAILLLLAFSKNPMTLHYKRFVVLNYETLGNVLQSTYSMMTVLSKFVR